MKVVASGLSLPIASCAGDAFPPGDARDALARYAPLFFSAQEWRFIMAAVSRLIPSDGDGPGALETHVPIFIDRQLRGDYGHAADWYMAGPHNPAADPTLGWQTPLTPAEVYRSAIAQVENWCRDRHGHDFADLSAAQQDDALSQLETKKLPLQTETRDFFDILLNNCREGYFADPIYGGNYRMQSWVYIGFPGARANFKDWVKRYNVPYPLGPVSIEGEQA
jgi:gluconate 2-dehydrogenase gamma chain